MRQIALWAMLFGSLLMLIFALNIAVGGSTAHIFLFSLINDLQFSFSVDRLAAFFLGIISFVSIAVVIYSLKYTEHHGTNTSRNFLVAMMSLFVMSMLLVVASDNTFSFLFFWEMMSLTSFFLVMFERDKADTKKSALFYFVMTQMSTTFLSAWLPVSLCGHRIVRDRGRARHLRAFQSRRVSFVIRRFWHQGGRDAFP